MSLVATLMQSLRAQYAPNSLDKNEDRGSRYGAYDFFKKDTVSPMGILTPEVRNLIKKSFGNSVVIPVLDAQDVTIGNVRSCTVVDSENNAALVTLTFATYAFGFTMTPSQHFNNDVSYQADFDRKLLKYLNKFLATLDSACVSQLETDKNQLGTVPTDFGYTFTANSIVATNAQKNDLYNNIQSMLNAMDFYGKPHIVSNLGGQPMVQRLANQGAGNSDNQQFQLSPYEWHWTNRIANAGGTAATMYAVQEGSVAIENRNDPDSILKHKIADVKEWDEVDVPLLGLKMGSFYTKDCADRSALHAGTTGLKRTLLEGFEWSTDICLVSAYNSNVVTKAGPISKIRVTTA